MEGDVVPAGVVEVRVRDDAEFGGAEVADPEVARAEGGVRAGGGAHDLEVLGGGRPLRGVIVGLVGAVEGGCHC